MLWNRRYAYPGVGVEGVDENPTLDDAVVGNSRRQKPDGSFMRALTQPRQDKTQHGTIGACNTENKPYESRRDRNNLKEAGRLLIHAFKKKKVSAR